MPTWSHGENSLNIEESKTLMYEVNAIFRTWILRLLSL